MLHFHYQILRLCVCIDALVKNLDDTNRWKLACTTISRQLRLLRTKYLLVVIDLDIEPIFDIVLVRISRDSHFVHQEQILVEHEMLVEIPLTEVLQLVES